MKINTRKTLAIIVLWLIYGNLYSQVSYPNKLEAFRCDSLTVKLDGILDEPCWQQAPKISNFTQRELEEGKPVTEHTEVAIVYSREKLYIGVWCYDSNPENITAKHMKRDFPYWTDDNFEVIFDTYMDKLNGYVFVINPNGSRSDVQTGEDGRVFNMDWNGVWDAAVQTNRDGWFAEIEIPFSTLKFPDRDVQEWGVNFERNIRRKQEQAFWQGWSRNYDFEHVSHAGILTGLRDIYGKENIELKPYVTSGIETAPGTTSNTLAKIGGDINYLITPTLKLNVTLNTDFAQVEDDRTVINLSRFSIFMPEKREFFLEGKDALEYNFYDNAKVFYTRRIGIQDGEQIPIIAGVRLTGKQDRTNIGALSIQTSAKGNIPSANYSVLRLSEDIFEKSNIGMIITAKNQADHYNYVYGANAQYSTAKFLGDKNLLAFGLISASNTSGDTDRRNLGFGGLITYPNDFINATAGYFDLQRDFNPEMGFLEKSNAKLLYADFSINPRPEFLPSISRVSVMPFKVACYLDDETNKPSTVIIQSRPLGITFKSGDWLGFLIERDLDNLTDDYDIFENIVIPKGMYWYTRYMLEGTTYEGRALNASCSFRTGTFYDGTAWSFSSTIGWNINKYINISFDYGRNDVHLKEGKFATDNIGGRFEIALNPKLYSSFFGQWDNVTNKMLLNFRLNWIPVVGRDFYLAVNQAINTHNNGSSLENTTILGKLVWRFGV